MKIALLFLLSFLSSSLGAKTYYLSPTGIDTNSGTMSSPFFTLNKAWTSISAGDTIYLRGGIYYYTASQYLNGKSGTNSQTIKIFGYPGEKPIITKSGNFGYRQNCGIYFSGNYFHWKGIEITGFKQVGIEIITGFKVQDANHNIFELLNSHHNGHGMILARTSDNNLILNSDFHHNSDPLTTIPYENADGLEICYIPAGLTNKISGCRFWWNSDDGIDLWENDGSVIIDSCWSWNNGYLPDTSTPAGNGVGFKLGKSDLESGNSIRRQVTNCLSYSNRSWGFHQNGANSVIAIYNNTSCYNGAQGYSFESFNKQHIVKNNISFQDRSYASLTGTSIVMNNTFLINNTLNTNFSLSEKDFISLDGMQLSLPRQIDGKLPYLDFMHLAIGSDLIDAGINVGLPFSEQAPDIGAFETASTAQVVANQYPVVSISSPLKSTSYTSPAAITLEAAASDPDGAIIKVEFFQGNTKIGEKIGLPYTFTWKEVSEGTYSLTAVATDNSGSKTVSAAVSITVAKSVAAENKLPIVSISSPTKGCTYNSPATVTIDINASDPDGSISKVELFNGAEKLYEKTAVPYSFTLKDLPAGSYVLKAVATDNLKATSSSPSLDLTVTTYYEAREYFNLYPNPNNGRFFIDFTTLLDADVFTLTVVDLIGNTVYREEFTGTEDTREFDLSHLTSGIYVLILAANQILLTQKFIKC